MAQKFRENQRVRVGVFLAYESLIGNPDGGGGTYENSLCEILRALEEEGLIQVVYFVPRKSRSREIQDVDSINGNEIVAYSPSLMERYLAVQPRSLMSHLIRKTGPLRTEKKLKTQSVDLVYFGSPSLMALCLETTPYLFTVWDLGHRDLPGFPEAASHTQWIWREAIYDTGAGRAHHVFVDSDSTAQRLHAIYGVGANRISVVGLLPRVPATVSDLPLIDGDYIMYPAARWPHKNHATLLTAMSMVLEEFPGLRLVLTGKDQGHGAQIDATIRSLGLGGTVIDLGLISREATLSLIKRARLLVMPSLLGPTNLPPLEALALGTRAIVSDVHNYGASIDDQVIKVPSTQPEAWAKAISENLFHEKKDPVVFSTDAALESHRAVFLEFGRILPALRGGHPGESH